MKCTSCQKTVKDGTSICPHCDAVLDESILGAMPAGDDDGGDDTPPPAPAPKKSSGARKAARKPAPVEAEPEAAPQKKPPASEGKYTNKYSQFWTEDDPPAKPVTSQPKGMQMGASGEGIVPEAHPGEKASSSSDVVDPLETLKGMWAAFLALHFEDKLTTSAAAGLVVSAFMPWRTTPEGDEMGLIGTGFFTALLAVCAVVFIWARKTGKAPALSRDKFPLGAIGAGALSALFCLVAVVGSYEKSVKGGKEVTLSEPAFGVAMAILFAAGIVVGGVLTLKREKK